MFSYFEFGMRWYFVILLSSSSSSSSPSNFLLLSFSWKTFPYPVIRNQQEYARWSYLYFKKFLTIEHVPRITDFCICMYVFGCRLSLFRLCGGDFGITCVDDIVIGVTRAVFRFHIAHISFTSFWYLFIIIVIIATKYHLMPNSKYENHLSAQLPSLVPKNKGSRFL